MTPAGCNGRIEHDDKNDLRRGDARGGTCASGDGDGTQVRELHAAGAHDQRFGHRGPEHGAFRRNGGRAHRPRLPRGRTRRRPGGTVCSGRAGCGRHGLGPAGLHLFAVSEVDDRRASERDPAGDARLRGDLARLRQFRLGISRDEAARTLDLRAQHLHHEGPADPHARRPSGPEDPCRGLHDGRRRHRARRDPGPDADRRGLQRPADRPHRRRDHRRVDSVGLQARRGGEFLHARRQHRPRLVLRGDEPGRLRRAAR